MAMTDVDGSSLPADSTGKLVELVWGLVALCRFVKWTSSSSSLPWSQHHKFTSFWLLLLRTQRSALPLSYRKSDVQTANDWAEIQKAGSHTLTVVRECCKDDDQSQWERPKFDPPATPKALNRSSPKFTYVIMSWISTIMKKFIHIG